MIISVPRYPARALYCGYRDANLLIYLALLSSSHYWWYQSQWSAFPRGSTSVVFYPSIYCYTRSTQTIGRCMATEGLIAVGERTKQVSKINCRLFVFALVSPWVCWNVFNLAVITIRVKTSCKVKLAGPCESPQAIVLHRIVRGFHEGQFTESYASFWRHVHVVAMTTSACWCTRRSTVCDFSEL